jgi:DNA polymerase phi
MFNLANKSQKTGKANDIAQASVDQERFKPIDLIVDSLIGHLEKSTTLMRVISGQVFTALCSKVEQSTMDLLLEVRRYCKVPSALQLIELLANSEAQCAA